MRKLLLGLVVAGLLVNPAWSAPQRAQLIDGSENAFGTTEHPIVVDIVGDITLENGELIDNGTDGVVCLKGAGGTNNEDICFDLESDANVVSIETTTAVNKIYSEIDLLLLDGKDVYFGAGFDSQFTWETTGNDNLQIGTVVGSATDSGYISIMEKADMGSANRSPTGTSNDPVFRVYSSDATQAGDYIEFSHDQSNPKIGWGNGRLDLYSPVNAGNLGFAVPAGVVAYLRWDIDTDEFMVSPSDSVGNQVIITNSTNQSKDHDHAVQTDPTLFIHSDTDPDSDNTQWMSLSHNKTDALITTGKGNILLNPISGIVNMYVDGSLGMSIKSDLVFDQESLFLRDNTGNQIVISNVDNISKDHDHAATTDPTLFIHSDTDPDTNNTQYGALYHDKTNFNINTGTGVIQTNAVVRGATSLYKVWHRLPLEAADPGASGATWTDLASTNLNGWHLDAAGELLQFNDPVLSDWDGASDITVTFTFQVDDATTSNNDTADLALVVYYMAPGDTTPKTQTIAEDAVVTTGDQWKMYNASFTLDYDATDNNIEVGDKIGMALHMETDTSEVDSILVVGGAVTYNSKSVRLEN